MTGNIPREIRLQVRRLRNKSPLLSGPDKLSGIYLSPASQRPSALAHDRYELKQDKTS